MRSTSSTSLHLYRAPPPAPCFQPCALMASLAKLHAHTLAAQRSSSSLKDPGAVPSRSQRNGTTQQPHRNALTTGPCAPHAPQRTTARTRRQVSACNMCRFLDWPILLPENHLAWHCSSLPQATPPRRLLPTKLLTVRTTTGSGRALSLLPPVDLHASQDTMGGRGVQTLGVGWGEVSALPPTPVAASGARLASQGASSRRGGEAGCPAVHQLLPRRLLVPTASGAS